MKVWQVVQHTTIELIEFPNLVTPTHLPSVIQYLHKNLTAECTVYFHSTCICTAVNMFREYAQVLLVNVVYIFPFRSTQRAGVGGAGQVAVGLRLLSAAPIALNVHQCWYVY